MGLVIMFGVVVMGRAFKGASTRWAMPVSMRRSRKSAWPRMRSMKGMLVFTPSMRVCASAWRSRAMAWARSLPWATSLATMGS